MATQFSTGLFSMSESASIPRPEPSAATASMFIYAHGPTIFCCRHDTLDIERHFSRHSADVELLAVDNQSEHGGGRLVVSCDADKNAIFWDLATGDEVVRFAAYEPLSVATWMKNGNIAFGTVNGTIVLFEPATSEHVSARTLDQICITALAPASDCRTFAIGYQNGSLLIAALQPRFQILHKLTTNRVPSPIITLAWHNSAPRQKADMLATQSLDGDLRVWSVSKSSTASDPTRVVRVLKRSDEPLEGPHWMGWSKNGRIIQYANGQTISWDVRTKYVTSDVIPTIGGVRSLALYGPSATLFTLGPASSVQQYDLNAPSVMVANVSHHVTHLPPSPPVSVEERTGQPGSKLAPSVHSEVTIPTTEMDLASSEDEKAHAKRRDVTDLHSEDYNRYDSASSLSSKSSNHSSVGPGLRNPSIMSHQQSDVTYISGILSPSVSDDKQIRPSRDLDQHSTSISSRSSASKPSSKPSSQPSSKPSNRPRNQIIRTANLNTGAENRQPIAPYATQDIFKFTRARLSDLSYRLPYEPQHARLTNDDLRQQMLKMIFGWQGEVDELIRDEISRHPAGSSCRIMLSKWLDDQEPDLSNSDLLTSTDWMLLALTNGGPQNHQRKLARAYLQRLLASEGDVHSAATIMVALGDHNDAIEIYVSHRKYMEALVLTCLQFPAVWERQSAIIKKWGEYSVQHGEQQLAIRCFACTDRESSEPWASPSAMQLNFASISEVIPDIVTSPALSPLTQQLGPQRDVAKSAALKLITTFSKTAGKVKFFGNEQTPIAAGVTPILDSALSPNRGVNSASYRPSPRSQFHSPVTARPSDRLPSIGENASRPASRTRKMPFMLMVQAEGTGDEDAGKSRPPMPSPNPSVMMKMQEPRSTMRSRSRDHMPVNLKLQLQEASELSSPGNNRFHWPSRRRGTSVGGSATGLVPGSAGGSVTGSMAGSVTGSIGSTAKSQFNSRSVTHLVQGGDGYSLSNATSRTQASLTTQPIDEDDGSHRSRPRSRSHGRGRTSEREREQSPKTSPLSPVSMSTQDIRKLSSRANQELSVGHDLGSIEAGQGQRLRSTSRGAAPDALVSSRTGRRGTGDTGGEQEDLDATSTLSAQFPVAAVKAQFEGSEDEGEYQLAMATQSSWRKDRSCSRARGESNAAKTFKAAAERQRSPSRERLDLIPQSKIGIALSEHNGDLKRLRNDRDVRRQNALTELEERRKLLTEVQPGLFSRRDVEPIEADINIPESSKSTAPARGMFASRNNAFVGLPATPKAMRLVVHSEPGETARLPAIPPTVLQRAVTLPPTMAGSMAAERRAAMPLVLPTAPVVSTASTATTVAAGSDDQLLTLLPSTVYQAPARLDRSSSAPVPESVLIPRGGSAPILSRLGSASPLMRNMGPQAQEHQAQAQQQVPLKERRPSRSEREPVTVLKELQHLNGPSTARSLHQHRVPPVPPPAPSFRPDLVLGGSAQVEVVHDDEDVEDSTRGRTTPGMYQSQLQQQQRPLTANSLRGHSRASASIGGGTNSKLAKASLRMRSQSRTRRVDVNDPTVHDGPSLPLKAKDFVRDAIASPGAHSVASTQGYSTGLTQEEFAWF